VTQWSKGSTWVGTYSGVFERSAPLGLVSHRALGLPASAVGKEVSMERGLS